MSKWRLRYGKKLDGVEHDKVYVCLYTFEKDLGKVSDILGRNFRVIVEFGKPDRECFIVHNFLDYFIKANYIDNPVILDRLLSNCGLSRGNLYRRVMTPDKSDKWDFKNFIRPRNYYLDSNNILHAEFVLKDKTKVGIPHYALKNIKSFEIVAGMENC